MKPRKHTTDFHEKDCNCAECAERIPVHYWHHDSYKGVRQMSVRLIRNLRATNMDIELVEA